jgi:hypothetical protein
VVTDPTPGPIASTRALPQSVLMPLTGSAIFLVVRIEPGGEEKTRDLLERVSGLTRSVGFRVPAGNLTCVTSIGSDVWDRLFSGPRPAELHPFAELRGAKHHAVSTPGDLLFHIRADRADLCFELERLLLEQLGLAPAVGDRADAAADVPGRPARAPRPHPRRLDRRHGCDVLRAAAAPARGARRRGVKPGPRPKAPSARPSADSKGTPL